MDSSQCSLSKHVSPLLWKVTKHRSIRSIRSDLEARKYRNWNLTSWLLEFAAKTPHQSLRSPSWVLCGELAAPGIPWTIVGDVTRIGSLIANRWLIVLPGLGAVQLVARTDKSTLSIPVRTMMLQTPNRALCATVSPERSRYGSSSPLAWQFTSRTSWSWQVTRPSMAVEWMCTFQVGEKIAQFHNDHLFCKE